MEIRKNKIGTNGKWRKQNEKFTVGEFIIKNFICWDVPTNERYNVKINISERNFNFFFFFYIAIFYFVVL